MNIIEQVENDHPLIGNETWQIRYNSLVEKLKTTMGYFPLQKIKLDLLDGSEIIQEVRNELDEELNYAITDRARERISNCVYALDKIIKK